MTTPHAFIMARLAEDEQAAREVGSVTVTHEARWIQGEKVTVEDPTPPFYPARVLAQCAVLREVVELHSPTDERSRWCDNCKGTDLASFPCPTLRALTAIWSTHADYDEGWAE